MVLQFRGYKNNWVYQSAKTIAITEVEITKADINTKDKEEELSVIKEVASEIEHEIRSAIGCGDYITYIVDKPLYELGLVKVAVLGEDTYVFDTNREVYLLNDNGKTVRRV